MKKLVWIVLALLPLILQDAFGQQIPLYSQYNQNPFLYNPALTGYRDNMMLHVIYRKQWTDFEGAPETRAVTLDGPLKSKKVGLGAYFYSDNTSIIRRIGGSLSYAYYIEINEDMRLGIGISAGMQQNRVDFTKATVIQSDDPLLSRSAESGVAFDAAAGLSYWWKGLSVGFSIPQLVETNVQNLTDDSPINYQMSRHYLATAAYDIPIKKDVWHIEPGVMFRATEGKAYQVDVNVALKYKSLAYLAFTYRYDYAVTIGAGIQLHERLLLGYAYDVAVNDLSGRAGGTHEMMVGIKFGKTEDKGLIEALQRIEKLEQVTGDHENRIDSIDQRNQKLQEELEKKDEEIERLKKEIQETIDAFSDSLEKAGEEKLPDDAIFEGNLDDLEFITGEPNSQYFMVVSSLRTEERARQIAKKYGDMGYEVGIVLNKRRSWYYVFLTKPGSLEDGLKELYKLREKDEFKEAWIHIYK